jgi:hypothetical protein
LSDGAQAVLPQDLRKIIKISDTVYKTIRDSDSPFSSDIRNGNGHA